MSQATASPRCPVPIDALLGEQRCGKVLGSYKGEPTLMCREHWRRVPPELQLRVWRTWRQLRREMMRSDAPAEYEQAALAYREQRERAIQAAAAAGGL